MGEGVGVKILPVSRVKRLTGVVDVHSPQIQLYSKYKFLISKKQNYFVFENDLFYLRLKCILKLSNNFTTITFKFNDINSTLNKQVSFTVFNGC